MAHKIRPASADDIAELSRFLTQGFQTSLDAAFAAPEVLRWKFFDPMGADAGDAPRSYVACDAETGRIVGHLGICPTRFRGAGLPPDGVSTQHVIDWLTSGQGKGAGATLLRRAHSSAATQYSFGMSPDAQAVGKCVGYELIAVVPVMQRVFRAGFRLRDRTHGPLGRLLRAGRDVTRNILRPRRPPAMAVELRPVAEFGPEIEPILKDYQSRAVFSSRNAGLLNHVLRYPCGGVSGWHVMHDGALLGFAVLSVVTKPGPVHEGRIAGCMLAALDADAWHAATDALTRELERQGADVAIAVASTNWTANALRAAGYTQSYVREFRIRDRSGAVHPASPFHLTLMEADYAYT